MSWKCVLHIQFVSCADSLCVYHSAGRKAAQSKIRWAVSPLLLTSLSVGELGGYTCASHTRYHENDNSGYISLSAVPIVMVTIAY